MIDILFIDGSYTLFLVQICQQMPSQDIEAVKLSSIVQITQYSLCIDEFLFSFEVYFIIKENVNLCPLYVIKQACIQTRGHICMNFFDFKQMFS